MVNMNLLVAVMPEFALSQCSQLHNRGVLIALWRARRLFDSQIVGAI